MCLESDIADSLLRQVRAIAVDLRSHHFICENREVYNGAPSHLGSTYTHPLLLDYSSHVYWLDSTIPTSVDRPCVEMPYYSCSKTP